METTPEASPPTRPDRAAPVGSVDHALDVLEAVAASGQGLGVTEIGRRIKLPKSTVFRLLAALSSRGYVARGNPPGRYRLGLKAWEIGSAYLNGLSFREVAHPIMDGLAREAGETAFLSICDQGAAVLIDTAEPPDPVRWMVPAGTRLPFDRSASGKVLLAFQPAETIEQVIEGAWATNPPPTPAERAALSEALEDARRTGWSVNRGTWHADVYGAAVPIFNHTKSLIAALGIAGPAERFLDKLPRLEPLLRGSSQQISRRLGCPD